MTTTYVAKSEKTYKALDVKHSYSRALDNKCRTTVTFTVPEKGFTAPFIDEITTLLRNYEFTRHLVDTPYFGRLSPEYQALFDHDGNPVRVHNKNGLAHGGRSRHSFFATTNKKYYEEITPGATIEFQFARSGRLEIEVAKQLRGILKQI
jgi:hypothetical protein